MAFFGLKLGLDLEIRAAHPHQKFQRVPPPPGLSVDACLDKTLLIEQSTLTPNVFIGFPNCIQTPILAYSIQSSSGLSFTKRWRYVTKGKPPLALNFASLSRRGLLVPRPQLRQATTGYGEENDRLLCSCFVSRRHSLFGAWSTCDC